MDRRSDYLYNLPKELIAQEPSRRRDASRLLVLDRRSGSLEHRRFADLPKYLDKRDVLVLNDTKVIPARVKGNRPTGGEVELLLLKETGLGEWECLAKPAKRLRVGEEIHLAGQRRAVILGAGEEGRRTVRFQPPDHFREWLIEHGLPPLPPYIRRDPHREDLQRYQTVYALREGAVAAPTAGLHFTETLLEKLSGKGVEIVKLTLHVGLGTFRPVTVEKLSEHVMDAESYEVSEEAAQKLNETRQNGGRIVAVGTTVVRTLETVCGENEEIRPGKGETELFIRPPCRIKAVDALITNFHLPGSTLLMLVSAFAGREKILAAYREAVHLKYRFFSYGDAMLIL